MSEKHEFYIYGRNPVIDKLTRTPDEVSKVYLKEGTNDAQIRHIQHLCSEAKVPVSFVPGKKLSEMVGKVNDQGTVALTSPVAYSDFEDWKRETDPTKNPVIIALSEIEDPGNFGAIMRSAAASGVDAILIPKHRQVPITPAVIKTSAGTAGIVPLVRVGNLNQCLSELKDAGFWIAGLDSSADSPIWLHDLNRPIVLILGSEGKGIREATLSLCDMRLKIPMLNQIDSLNVSATAAIILFEILRQKLTT
jgi:23S rRNA (guanosine2251-2'-O)-methyltransferase